MDNNTFSPRVHAVLDHDGIHPKRKAGHLARSCGVSESTARRILAGNPSDRLGIWIKLSKGLDVDLAWLGIGNPQRWHPRTWRILLENIKGLSPEEAASIMRLFTGFMLEHTKAINLLNLVSTGHLSVTAAARLL
jgi:hypothetical protein